MIVGLITQLVQGMGEFNVQKHGKVGRSIDAVVGLDGATLGHFFDLLDECWIATAIGSRSSVGLRLKRELNEKEKK
jgi:hypothetical protein